MVTRATSWGRTLSILDVFYRYYQSWERRGKKDTPPSLRMRQVAFWLNLSPSTYLCRKLEDMVVSGWLDRVGSIYRPNIVAQSYSLTQAGIEMAEEHIRAKERML